MKKPRVKTPPVKKAPVQEAPGAKTTPVKKTEHILKRKGCEQESRARKETQRGKQREDMGCVKVQPTLEPRGSDIWLRYVVP